MPIHFTPPTGEGMAWSATYRNKNKPAYRLMRYLSTCPMGFTVWEDLNGVFHQAQYPLDTNFQVWMDTAQPNNARHVYLGGHTTEIDAAEAINLILAGYGDGVVVS